jgi:tRNA U34 2-thiouridine synthase MnmA/TrmU
MLAVRLIQRQGIEVIAFHARHLWGLLPADPTEKPPPMRAAEALGVPLHTIDAADADIQMIQHPRHGLGKRMNPCIDCRIWVLAQAKAFMESEGASFVFTGEVLGQRPMSQRRPVLDLVARESGLGDLLVRPLSAQRLEPTRPEREGLLDRAKLLGIIGRSRHVQIALAAEFGLTDYPSPAGGCLLTDPGFAFRLRALMARKTPAPADIDLLKAGRHFRLADSTLVVIGRNYDDNLRLERLLQPGDVRLEAAVIPGPTTLLRGAASPENVALAAGLTLRYTKAERGKPWQVVVTPVGGEARTVEVAPAEDALAQQLIVSPEKLA